jgi:hypothetical protein
MAKTFRCERDGVVIHGENDADLIANVQRHLADKHPDLVGKVSREDILDAAEEG